MTLLLRGLRELSLGLSLSLLGDVHKHAMMWHALLDVGRELIREASKEVGLLGDYSWLYHIYASCIARIAR
jgi:hypothetical protein